jgi:acetyltransferase-like isoleucine patch superfamily enzyme
VSIDTAASIDRDNFIGDFAHVSPHATLCGHVSVGEGTHVGAGATVIQNIQIGKWCSIGAGSVVIRDIPDYATAVGNPARVIKIEGKPV